MWKRMWECWNSKELTGIGTSGGLCGLIRWYTKNLTRDWHDWNFWEIGRCLFFEKRSQYTGGAWLSSARAVKQTLCGNRMGVLCILLNKKAILENIKNVFLNRKTFCEFQRTFCSTFKVFSADKKIHWKNTLGWRWKKKINSKIWCQSLAHQGLCLLVREHRQWMKFNICSTNWSFLNSF